MPSHLERLERLQRHLLDADVEALVVTNHSAIRYLTGFATSSTSRFLCVTVSLSGPPSQLLPHLETGLARTPEGVITRKWDDGVDPLDELRRLLSELGVAAGRIGIESNHVSLATADRLRQYLPQATFVTADHLVDRLRARKSPEEVGAIKKASHLVCRAVDSALAAATPGARELDLKAKIDFELTQSGSEESWAIALSGPNTALPHGRATARRLEPNDIVLIDIMASVDGYYSDITRCACLGSPTANQLELWQTLVEAQAAGIAAVAPGVTAGEVDRATREVIEARGLGEAFVHRTGHGIGIDVSEAPNIAPGDETLLETGMTLTVEPGMYFPDIGGLRLEDTLLVSDTGTESLTAYPKELTSLL